MKRFVAGADRGQWTLLPECLDDFIDDSNPVRVIDVFVDRLDLAEMNFEGIEPATTGRPSYHPSVLLKLYIYGYLNRVQSSRRLEREAGRNMEVMWLLGRLAPDHKTIADFRKDNSLALRRVCARFVELCREMGLLTTASGVTSLETLLGSPLFDRRGGGYALTVEGKAVLDEARSMDEAALSVLRRLDAGTELSGLVRLTVGRVLAERFVIDRLHTFHERYPAIDLEVVGGSRVVSLARREADVALHYGSPKDSELVARRVAKITFGLYASPAYRDRLKAGNTPAFIGFDEESDFVAEAAWLARRFGNKRFSFRTNSQTTQAAAARAGYGVALLPRYVAADDQGLAKVLLGERLPEREVWLLIRRDLAKVPRVRAVTDYLIEMFRRERRLLTG